MPTARPAPASSSSCPRRPRRTLLRPAGRRRGRPRGRPAGSVRVPTDDQPWAISGSRRPTWTRARTTPARRSPTPPRSSSPRSTETPTAWSRCPSRSRWTRRPRPRPVPPWRPCSRTRRTRQQAQGFHHPHPAQHRAGQQSGLDEDGVLLVNLNSNIDTIQAEAAAGLRADRVHGRQLRRGGGGAVPGRRAAPGRSSGRRRDQPRPGHVPRLRQPDRRAARLTRAPDACHGH